MLKKISLAKKIAGGFVIILLLLLVLALAGRIGLIRVVERVDSADRFQALVERILAARQDEMRFIMTRAPDAVDALVTKIQELQSEARNISDQAQDPIAGKNAMGILKAGETYARAFEEYVRLAKDRDSQMEEMNQKAGHALEITARIRDEQKVAYDGLAQESGTRISRMRFRVSYGEAIKENFLKAQALGMVLTGSDQNNLAVVTQWKGLHTDIANLLDEIAPAMTEDTARQRHAALKDAQARLLETADLFFQDKTPQNKTAMIEAAEILSRDITYFQQEMQELLEFYMEEIQLFSDQVMELSSGAGRITAILLETRILEKEFIRTGDGKQLETAVKNLGAIAPAIAGIVEKIDDPEKTKILDGIQAGVNEYIESFTAYAKIMEHQQGARDQMEDNAAGIQTICLSAKSKQARQMRSQIRSSTAVITGVSAAAVILGVLIAVLLARMIIAPLLTVVAALRDIAQGEGDLTRRIKVDTWDEIGALATWFNRFVSRINQIIVDIGANGETVTASSEVLLRLSTKMEEDSRDLSQRANSVAAAAEEMSVSMNSVAAGSEQASANLASVADSASQMKETIHEVAGNCDRAKSISEQAAEQARTASQGVERLGVSARDIDKVTQVITDIAEQTNLLALNATIEAARAGESGKGFAVVASEIKGLAAQTAEATLDIKDKIQDIQDSTEQTVREVEAITGVISEVTQIVSAIAAAVEEQSVATSEVAGNIDQASAGIHEVNAHVAQISQVSSGIADDISEVHQKSEGMSRKSVQVKVSAQELSALSQKLREMIGVFKVAVTDVSADKSDGQSPGHIPDLMVWGEDLKIGLASIDDQHRDLVEMINELYRAMKIRKGAREVGGILEKLFMYTGYHFKTEEDLFETHEYPDRATHKNIHDDLVKRVVEIQKDFQEGRAALSMDLMQFLKDWLENHILKTDREYVAFLKEKGVQ